MERYYVEEICGDYCVIDKRQNVIVVIMNSYHNADLIARILNCDEMHINYDTILQKCFKNNKK